MTDAMEKLKELTARMEVIETLGKQQVAELRSQLEISKKETDYERQLAAGFQKQVLGNAKDAAFGRKFFELMAEYGPPVSSGAGGKHLTVTDPKYTVDLKDDNRLLTEETTTCRGRLLKLMKLGFFDEPKTIKDIAEIFPKKGWPDEEKTIANNIAEMFRESFFTKEQIGDKSHRRWVYGKPDGIVFK